MADIDVHKKEFMVRELATQTIVLYPTRAQVVRSLVDLSLTPGSNEVTIYGITPTADESSIKVEGTGVATITDMTVDLVDNREHYEEVYPSESDSDSGSDSSSDSDEESQAIEDLSSQIQKLELSIKDAAEERNSAQGRLNMLENYARSLTTSRPDNITACVQAYSHERSEAFEGHKNGEVRVKENEKEISKLKRRRSRMLRKLRADKTKAERAKVRQEKKRDREKQQKLTEKSRVKRERIRFWPSKVYKIVLCLDANSGMTPMSSRRSSMDSVARTPQSSVVKQQSGSDNKVDDACKINLSFSYITYSASWSPRYDLTLDTASKSGAITYRAEFRNTTSETWRDAKVILSTSQTSFQGLAEAIPQIQPWHIRLAAGFGNYATDDALYSRHEQDTKSISNNIFNQKPQLPRSQLFGMSKDTSLNLFGNLGSQQPLPPPPAGPPPVQQLSVGFGGFGSRGGPFGAPSNAAQPAFGGGLFGSSSNSDQPARTGGVFGASTDAIQLQPAAGGGLFGSSTRSGGLFGAPSNAQQTQQASSSSLFSRPAGPLQVQPNIVAPRARQDPIVPADEEEADLDTETIAPGEAALAFEESTWEEAGLTATYTVPGTKTISPSNTTRRHKVASIPLSGVTLSHIIVPKLRTAAFLKARLRNTSSTTLLKGPAGLTIDGTFLGNTTLPRSSPSEAFVLNLGVDPALNVIYSKPTVHRSQSGVFQKEGSCIYRRSCTLTNTKNNTAIEATVLDQVPVSEDDKLKVEILTPRGLYKEGDQVAAAGTGQINEGTGKKGSTYADTSSGKTGVKWGKASAKMKKEGEIEWDIKLNPGQGVKLELEYEARFPSGSGVVGVH
ncbi:MAG: hypothetical protein Q9218_001874 [Villophora microphyllina]